MMNKKKITIIGAGAIGCSLAAKMSNAGHDITMIVRKMSDPEMECVTLSLLEDDHEISQEVKVSEKINNNPDFVIITVKNQDLKEVIKVHLSQLLKTKVILIQNGVNARNIAEDFLDKKEIISLIVLYNCVLLDKFKVEMSNRKAIIFSRQCLGSKLLEEVFLESNINYSLVNNIQGAQFSKLIVNCLGNSLEGITGENIKKLFEAPEYRKLGVLMLREMFDILAKQNIELEQLPSLPIFKIKYLVRLPMFLSTNILGRIVRKSANEKIVTSTLQDLKNNRKTEIDYLNGTFVNLGKDDAVISRKLVTMIKKIESGRSFYTKSEIKIKFKL